MFFWKPHHANRTLPITSLRATAEAISRNEESCTRKWWNN